MDPVLDRVRAANPVCEDEFAGRAAFEALSPPPRRRRRRLLAIPALGAIAAALMILPNAAPQASEVLERAVQAVEVDDGGILYARSDVRWGPTGEAPAGTQSRQVWVQGDTAMRWLEDGGNEEVYAKGEGTTRRSPDGKVRTEPDMQMVPNEIFRARGLLERARNVGLEETDAAYVLRWREKSGPPHFPTIEMTMWIDKETYEPLRFTDHSFGRAADGKPFDETYTEEIREFETLPDTPENRRLLELG
jgi:outer membrane lipoprotein-sorting protein